MDISMARDSINKSLIAKPEHWGTYIVTLLRIWENLQAPCERYHWKGEVKIIECIGNPSQLTIDGKFRCSRIAYSPGAIENFNISEMEAYNG